jgi:hypothetical protein
MPYRNTLLTHFLRILDITTRAIEDARWVPSIKGAKALLKLEARAMLSGNGHQVESSSKENWFQKLWTSLTEDTTLSSTAHSTSTQVLRATTHKLVQVHYQVDRLMAQHNLEMTRLAQAYSELSLQDRAALPQNLRQQLNRIESEYF